MLCLCVKDKGVIKMTKYELVENLAVALMAGLVCAGGVVALLWVVHLWQPIL